MFDQLVQTGSDASKAKNNGATLVFIASQFGHLDVVNRLLDRLLKAGADANKATNNGWTPLAIATRNGNLRVAARLMQTRARSWLPW